MWRASGGRHAPFVATSLGDFQRAGAELWPDQDERGTVHLRLGETRQVGERRVQDALLGERCALDDRHRHRARLAGIDEHPGDARSFAFSAIALMSEASASVTTSASRPSITVRACLPEPPCDCLMVSLPVILSPLWACQCLAKAALKS